MKFSLVQQHKGVFHLQENDQEERKFNWKKGKMDYV